MSSGDRRSAPDRPAAGWRPDPHDPTRRRYWDGERWSGLALSTDGAPDEPGSDPAGATPRAEARRTPEDRPGQSRVINAALAVALILVVGIGVLLFLRTSADPPGTPVVPTEPTPLRDGDDPGTDDGDASASPPEDRTPAGGEEPGAGEAPATNGTAPPGGDDTPDAPSTQRCEVDPETLLALAEAHPPLEPWAGDLNVADVRCVGGWATAEVWATGTDVSLGVFRLDDDWEFLLLGASEPCSGLGIPAETEQLLGCDFGA